MAYFKIGDKVRVRNCEDAGTITNINTFNTGFNTYDVEFTPWSSISVIEEWLTHWEDVQLPQGKKCTCGSSHVKGLEGHHVDWCDLFVKE